jgi:putative tryptophan/tyrosine transport system substrate-binding protein
MGQGRRRQYLFATGALLVATLAPSLGAHAQQARRVYRVGVLFAGGSDTMGPHRDALREHLALQGFVEGRNLQTIWRTGGEDRRQERETARELVAARSDAILTFSSGTTQAAQWATKSIPIVFTHVSDPIADGVVKDYARPGGNTTGVSIRHRELLGKRFELLRDLLPHAKRVALVTPYATDLSYAASESIIRNAAARLNFELIEIPIRRAFEIEEKRAEAIIIFFSLLGQRLTTETLVGLAARLRIASIFPDAEAVALGGLASYGTDPLEDTRLGADQLVRVLKGAKPSALPVDQNSRFVLAINMKSARALGITIPPTVFVRADRVIE